MKFEKSNIWGWVVAFAIFALLMWRHYEVEANRIDNGVYTVIDAWGNEVEYVDTLKFMEYYGMTREEFEQWTEETQINGTGTR